MNSTTIRSLALGAILITAASGCSLISKKSSASTGGGGGGAAAAIADNMHDAPVHHKGETFKFTAPCRASGYAKFDVPDGEAVKITVTGTGPEGAGLNASYLRSTGGAVDGQMKGDLEVAKGPIVFDVTGQDGGSFLQIMEVVPCKGVDVSVSVE
jgi:galactokinase